MKLAIGNGYIVVTRGDGDPRASTESHFWYQLRQRLNHKQSREFRVGMWAQGPETMYQTGKERWVRQVPSKDGHLTSAPYYLRERTPRKTSDGFRVQLAITDGVWMIESPHVAYNRGESVSLYVDELVVDEK